MSSVVAEGIALEAPTGIEPVIKVLQTSALPLGHGALGHYEFYQKNRLTRNSRVEIGPVIWCPG